MKNDLPSTKNTTALATKTSTAKQVPISVTVNSAQNVGISSASSNGNILLSKQAVKRESDIDNSTAIEDEKSE